MTFGRPSTLGIPAGNRHAGLP